MFLLSLPVHQRQNDWSERRLSRRLAFADAKYVSKGDVRLSREVVRGQVVVVHHRKHDTTRLTLQLFVTQLAAQENEDTAR